MHFITTATKRISMARAINKSSEAVGMIIVYGFGGGHTNIHTHVHTQTHA